MTQPKRHDYDSVRQGELKLLYDDGPYSYTNPQIKCPSPRIYCYLCYKDLAIGSGQLILAGT